MYIVLESGRKKNSIRDTKATPYHVQHQNPKIFLDYTNQHHSATDNSIQQQLASHCNCEQHTTTRNIPVQHVTSYVLLQQTHSTQQHRTTSADTNQHHSATDNSIQQQLASHCNCEQHTTTCNIPVQHETSYVLIQHITLSGRI